MTFPRIPAPRLRPWQICLLAAGLSILSSLIAGRWIDAHRPKVHDEFAYLLQAETFAAGRLSNPAHPLADFFQAPHVLVEPVYTAKYPPGHAVFLALGIHLGDPIRGVWIENAVFAAALAWMLLVFFPPNWALLGVALALLQFGGLHPWTQSFWITPMAAAGGALVWGGAFALKRRCAKTDGLLLGLGAGFLMMSRPFEGLMACIVPCGVVAWACLSADDSPARLRLLLRGLLPAALVVALFFGALALYNRAVTGDPFRLPYSVYEKRHSGLALFAWQKQPEPGARPFSAPLLNAYHKQYAEPMSSVRPFSWDNWWYRVRLSTIDNLGWCLAPLAALGTLLAFARRGSPPWSRLAATTFAVCSGSFLVSIWFDARYHIAVVPPLLLLVVFALRAAPALWSRGRGGVLWPAVAALTGTAAAIVFVPRAERSLRYFRQIQPVVRVTEELRSAPDKFLILVDVTPPYTDNIHYTYVANAPDIDRSQVVWAWDLGPLRNQEILAYYPDRKVLLMRAAGRSIEFLPYPTAPIP